MKCMGRTNIAQNIMKNLCSSFYFHSYFMLYSVRFLCSGLLPPQSITHSRSLRRTRSIFTPIRVGHKLIEWQHNSYNGNVHLFLHERCEMICLFCEMFVNVCLPACLPVSMSIDHSANLKKFLCTRHIGGTNEALDHSL